ncbi:MAG TPA: GNAT family N-acetyltransferase [Nocardioidaceae bacterium]|nr:GNAT family N-acetyltransferase [Nocardioidaceae bacterium]
MRFPEDVPLLSDGVVTLRPHREDDLQAIVDQSRDEETARWTGIPSPYTLDDAKRYVREFAPAGWTLGNAHEFAIEVDGRFAGSCALRDYGHRRAEVGYTVHPAQRGRGLMERALRLLVGWAFETGRFDALVWYAYPGNWASRRVAWKLGFSCHGPLEDWQPQRGALQDSWAGVLRKTDPREPRQPWYDAPRILGANIALRPIVKSDGERIEEALNDPVSQQWLRVPADLDVQAYVEERRELMASGRVVYWTMADPDSDVLLGAVMLFDIEPGVDAEVGYWTHPAARGRGVTTEACRLAVRHAFVPTEDGGMGLNRVTAYAGVDNAASLRVLENVGFSRYGVERLGGGNGRGERFDLVCHDLMAEEWSG